MTIEPYNTTAGCLKMIDTAHKMLKGFYPSALTALPTGHWNIEIIKLQVNNCVGWYCITICLCIIIHLLALFEKNNKLLT